MHQETVHYSELKVTENNINDVEKAKEREIQNLREFSVFEKLKGEGQTVIGTRYVLTEKPDGSVKACFVVKGYQEKKYKHSDSQTAERKTLKVFLSIFANE